MIRNQKKTDISKPTQKKRVARVLQKSFRRWKINKRNYSNNRNKDIADVDTEKRSIYMKSIYCKRKKKAELFNHLLWRISKRL